MANIKYITGDVTQPVGDGIKLICHINNDIGAWGAGVVLAISKRWKQPEDEYRRIPASKRKIGHVQYIPVGDNTYVCNMIAQNNIRPNEFAVPPIRYEAIEVCLQRVVEFAGSLTDGTNKVSLHLPRIGAGLAGGKWKFVEFFIKETIPDNIPVFVYDLPVINPHTVAFTTGGGRVSKDERN
jgi:O-acetyl-ADP-ribose deacetylase (regulator of RNase III)